ncbi:carnitine 3-dehydrogenase [Oceaniglobus trochenteri]|uniref:carnitine 3-dehydrogenase n=1 Tax=Oceaniglobus trochenteri TaxID=2763260 RepID=UPI001CFFE208
MTGIAAIIGGGVIGGGWAARFALMGWEVRVCDPDPEAARKLEAVLAAARSSFPGLWDVALPPEGQVTLCATLEEAVEGATWVQESVPERLDLKHRILRAVQVACAPGTVVASSTSGFRPAHLREGALRPGEIIVAHPFNPVYLLPLVEVVGEGPLIARACALLSSLGMDPLHLRHEIDGHLADRLLESVWREALWLIEDGLATTDQIDRAIRMGFGLRWAQMGLFETYRIAGGEAGMAHFIEQFGPCLHWPWSRLTDVPELTGDLVARIAAQSDAQSGHMDIRVLERARDTNLVAILRALKAQDWGAGALLRHHDTQRRAVEWLPEAPLVTAARAVPPDWTDANGHMTEARYLQAFCDASDRFLEILGCDADYIARGQSFFTAETHIRHLNEARAGERIRIETLCLKAEGAKLHLFHQLYRDEMLLATGEHFLLHVSLDTRRPVPPEGRLAARMAKVAGDHGRLARPDGIGRAVGRK